MKHGKTSTLGFVFPPTESRPAHRCAARSRVQISFTRFLPRLRSNCSPAPSAVSGEIPLEGEGWLWINVPDLSFHVKMLSGDRKSQSLLSLDSKRKNRVGSILPSMTLTGGTDEPLFIKNTNYGD